MPRKKIIKNKFPLLDYKYNSYLINLFILQVLKSGKKNLARNIVYNTCNIIKYQTNANPLEILEKAIINISPIIGIKAKNYKKSIVKIPQKIDSIRATKLSFKWLIKFSKENKKKKMSLNLAYEIIKASKKLGNSFKEKQKIHKIAKSNKKFLYLKK
uniref:Ribosomal protein S7 n=1 Tax=Nitzschia sp. (in: diatoms) TaxID=1884248 RepID=A0A5J6DUG5_9STRA|nr:ribosomal protein S7 [Nitzschia sp. (in: diatoms)]